MSPVANRGVIRPGLSYNATRPEGPDSDSHMEKERRMAAVRPKRSSEIEGRKVLIFDDLVSDAEISMLNESLKVGHFSKTEFARQETMTYKHWVLELGVDQVERLSIYNASRRVLREFFGETKAGDFRCFRAYCNVAHYGDMLMTHRDCNPEKDNVVTALWYVCQRWETDWGGETLFYNEDGDAEFVVSPRPGRLAIFDGGLTHVGRPPNRICYEPRYTLAIKFVKEG